MAISRAVHLSSRWRNAQTEQGMDSDEARGLEKSLYQEKVEAFVPARAEGVGLKVQGEELGT